MCGIAVIWGVTNESLVRKLMDRIVHRGPDSNGVMSTPSGTLGHQRLSIMDPRRIGDQPILSEDGSSAIVANGEIYNYKELSEGLSRHQFRTSTDTEVALHLYEEVGVETASRLDGMFSLIISDKDGGLYVARDPVGIKPLYYGYAEGSLIFASELKALSGFARNVKEFPPGTYYHSQVGFRKYYDIPVKEVSKGHAEEVARDVRETIEKSVVKRLMSDVPLGAFLSGGLDSSIIAAIARKHVDELHTFSVGTEGSSDLEAARKVAKHLDTVHHEYIFTEDEVTEHLPEILFSLESYDQDLVRSAAPCYFVSRLASQYVKVILTGEGADELFGGYTYYKNYSSHEKLSQELKRSISSLHNVNLQRVDRLTMTHSIEGRVPFLDLDVIELAQRIPVDMKIKMSGESEQIEKWILRKAFEDMLPADIVWRDKEQFDEGSGTSEMLGNGLKGMMSEEDAETYITSNSSAKLRSMEECIYHKLLSESYEDPSIVLENVARWANRPEFSEIK